MEQIKQSIKDLLQANKVANDKENRYKRVVVVTNNVGRKVYSACYDIDTIYKNVENYNDIEKLTIKCYPINTQDEKIDNDYFRANYRNNCIDAEPCVTLVCKLLPYPTIVDADFKDGNAGKGYRYTTLQILKECIRPFVKNDRCLYAYKVRESDVGKEKQNPSTMQSIMTFVAGRTKHNKYQQFLIDTGFNYDDNSLQGIVCNCQQFNIGEDSLSSKSSKEEPSYVLNGIIYRPLAGEKYCLQTGRGCGLITKETFNYNSLVDLTKEEQNPIA